MSSPLAWLLIQTVGSFGAHLHPLASSVVAAHTEYLRHVGERRAYFGRRLGGDPVDYLLIKDG